MKSQHLFYFTLYDIIVFTVEQYGYFAQSAPCDTIQMDATRFIYEQTIGNLLSCSVRVFNESMDQTFYRQDNRVLMMSILVIMST